MALRMVALNKAADGRWFARKVIPEDVRDQYASLYGMRREAHLKLPGDTPRAEAKVQLAEWTAEIETRIETLRAQKNGKGQPLTKINAVALAGRWYIWFVKQHEDDPGPEKRWKDVGEQLIWDVLYPHAPDSYLEDPKADPHWAAWIKDPEVREAVRPQIAEEARVARFLASEGLALNTEAYARFVDAVSDNLYPAISLLQRRAAGDYSPDPTPETFPPFTEGPARASSGPSCWELFEAFVKATKPAENTVQRWRAVFLEMEREFADRGANGITEDAARAWITGLVREKRSALTVREVWLSSSRRVFSWALEHKRISKNPFAEVKVDVRQKARSRETKAFTDAEARMILKAALANKSPKTPWERAKRWVMWLCAYSGARAGEVTQLRGEDIEKRGGFHFMKLTPDAGTIKTRKTRIVPLHEHVIAHGFLEMVRKVGKGALFYDDKTPHRASSDPMKPSRSRAGNVRGDLAEWVREIGVTDKEVSPTHAWRHTFKQIAERVGITEKIHDAITGHAPASEGRKYGQPTADDMARALEMFPRYKLD
jgi:integrase